ncbi:MAG TPA: G1 family glutamic endopeptidase [Pseudonocardiaceae bacterium]|jgi:hypothetical protein
MRSLPRIATCAAFCALLSTAIGTGSAAAAPQRYAEPLVDNGLYAGYIAYNGHYTSVSASWTEPTVNCSPNERSSAVFWTGLDGYGTSDLEQIGTAVDCYSGSPSYSAWYEWFPAGGVGINEPVRPGDQFSSSESTDGNGNFSMTLTNSTAGWSQTYTDYVANAPLSSAEVVVEPPTVGSGPLPLANFNSVTFANADVNGSGIGNSTNGKTDIDINGGGLETSTSDLSGAKAFSVTWLKG